MEVIIGPLSRYPGLVEIMKRESIRASLTYRQLLKGSVMGTKANPSQFDCYANAEPDEPMFVLLGRDQFASTMVESWAINRSIMIDRGDKPESDRAMVKEAYACAAAMREWYRKKNPIEQPTPADAERA